MAVLISVMAPVPVAGANVVVVVVVGEFTGAAMATGDNVIWDTFISVVGVKVLLLLLLDTVVGLLTNNGDTDGVSVVALALLVLFQNVGVSDVLVKRLGILDGT